MKRLAFLLTLLIPVFSFSQIINIPNDYPTIQEGIDIAHSGDTVLVDIGTYYENINYKGKAITVASKYFLSADSTYINNTIIDGSQSSHPDSASVVMFLSGEDTTSVLCGFTITGGSGFVYPSIYSRGGGGIVGMASGATIMNNIIINNSLENENRAGGGGISFLGGTSDTWVIIIDNIIKSNEVTDPISAYGGGVYVSSNSRVERNIIENNTCTSITGYAEGGGIEIQDIFTSGFNLILKNNTISENLLDGKYSRGAGICYLSGISKSNHKTEILYNPPPLKTLIANNIINSNTAIASEYLWGVGVYFYRPTTEVNIFLNEISYNNVSVNQTTYGSGLFLAYADDKKILIDANQIIGNQSEEGGGFFIQNSYNIFLTNNLFISNSANKNGGALRLLHYNGKEIYSDKMVHETENNIIKGQNNKRDFEPIYSNNTFADNSAEIGGAIYIKNEPYNPLICNSIFWGNTTLSGNGKDITIDGSSTATLNYNDIDSEYIEGNWTGTGNIFDNPKFVNSGNHPYQINDYSPCIDAGTPDTTGLNLPEYDLAGEARIFNDRVDMGAYEWNMMVGIEESSMPETNHLQVNNYPNPFTTSTSLEYTLNQPQTVTITFYNQFGKQVEVIEESQQKGLNRIVWTPENLADGVYYFRLQTGEQVVSGKMVLVK